MFKNNLKIAFRSLLRRRIFTTINITGLALGMAAAIFAILWVQNEMSFNNYHEKADNIYRINNDWQFENGDKWEIALTSLPIVETIKSKVPGAVRVGTLMENRWRPFTLKKDALILKGKRYTFVNEDWFEMFNHQFLSGTSEGFQDNMHSAIITKGFAERLLGEWNVVGETFYIDSTEFVVQAIIENQPPNSSFSYEMVLPLSYYLSKPTNKANETWNNANFLTFVELYPTTNPVEFGQKLTETVNKLIESADQTFALQSLSTLYFDEHRTAKAMATGNKNTTYIIGMIGLIILFLACINYVSLTTAQAGVRTKDVGVRKIIGAEGGQIFKLFFSESLITAMVALVLALSIVQLSMPFFNNFVEKTFLLNFQNPAIWMVCGGTVTLILLLSGIYPALFLTGFSPKNFLSGQNILKLKNATFRKGLVIVQFAITIGLIVGAMVIFQQQEYIRQKELGYNKSHVFEFSMPYSSERANKIKAMRQSLAGSPSVIGTAAANGSIINMVSTHKGTLDWDGRSPDFIPEVGQFSVDADFAQLMQIKLIDGRWFFPDNESDANNVILNETAVKQFNLPKPVIGQRFDFQRQKGQVIGVVKDFHYRSMHETIEPLVFYSNSWSHSNILVRTTEGKVKEAIAAADKVWSRHNPEQPFEYHFMDDSFDQLYKSEAKSASLFQLLAGLAIFISCLGLFGLAVFSTEQRTKEIGIRKVLGASVASIIGLLSKDFLKLIFIAILIAFPLAYYFMEEWLTNFAYRIEMPLWVFLVAGVLTIALALLTVGAQSLKAATVNPVKSLKTD